MANDVTAVALIPRLRTALHARPAPTGALHEGALRLFNGFYEGCRGLVIDLYAATLVIFNHADSPGSLAEPVQAALAELRGVLPWLRAVLVKTRSADLQSGRWGTLAWGDQPDTSIREHGVRYALDLTLNQDASFYMDTRELRAWALRNLAGKSVLNTFAYTGSLGTAARAGGASRVVHLDLNRRFLKLAKDSYALNGLAVEEADFMSGDFFPLVGQMRRENQQFDCVILDPPFFSSTPRGSVDQLRAARRLVNKVRPLVSHNGWLVAVNNALFLSGKEYLQSLEELCSDGYLTVEELIPVPPDITGYPETICDHPPVDPAPFNHPTKIAVLRVRRKGT